jgi:azurin
MEPGMFPIDRGERPDSVQQERTARQQELQRSYGHAKARRPTRSKRHGHNWVLTATADYQAVAAAGQAAGPPNYVPAGDARVLAATNVVGGGQETSVKFDLSKLTAGDYTYFCSFPGHFVLMNGKLIVE